MRSESCRFLNTMQPVGKSEYLAHSCYQSNRIDTGSYRVQRSFRDWSDILENISLIKKRKYLCKLFVNIQFIILDQAEDYPLNNLHRRTGNFLPGGGGWGKPFAQKNLAGCPNVYERGGKKGGPYYSNIGRTGI